MHLIILVLLRIYIHELLEDLKLNPKLHYFYYLRTNGCLTTPKNYASIVYLNQLS